MKLKEVLQNSPRVKKAYDLAKELYGEEKRISGQLWFDHGIKVAETIANINLDEDAIITSILHDTLERNKLTLEEIEEAFGTDVALLVDGVRDIRRYSDKLNSDEVELEDFRRLILRTAQDIRVVLVRIAEKMDSLTTLGSLSLEKKLNGIKRSKQVYARLCEYLGIGSWQRFFEDKSFELEKPDEFRVINNEIEKILEENQEVLNSFELEVKKLFSSGLNLIELKSRQKGIYSSYKKIRRKYLSNDETISKKHVHDLNDLLGIRIIVEKPEECYLALGLIHKDFIYNVEEFDDYIVNPRPNGYRSIHTQVKYKDKDIDIQIRTKEMHDFNEFGPASHISYKQVGNDKSAGETFNWIKDLNMWREDGVNYKITAFSKSIFVFTPKGRIIMLDTDSTPLDFVFQIHTELGYHYRGALVNGKMVSMDFKLKTGDTVEILTNKTQNVSSDWLNKCKMNYTKSKIRRVLNSQEFLNKYVRN